MQKAFDHHKDIQCSCCSPLWKHFIPANTQLTQASNQLQTNAQVPAEPWIFRVGSRSGPGGLTEGTILTLANGQNHSVEAIGVAAGRIVATGSYDSVKALMPEGTSERVLSSGQTIIPGLIETHVHIIPTALFNLFHDVSPFGGQYLRKGYNQAWVVEELKTSPVKSGEWIIGRGVDPSLFVDGSGAGLANGADDHGFNVTTLNKVSDTNPVFVINASMHLAYINQVAIDVIKGKNPDAVISADGILRESAQVLPVVQVIVASLGPDFSDKLLLEIHRMFHEASERGVTFLFDAGLEPFNSSAQTDLEKDQPGFLQGLAEQADCPIRLGGAISAMKPDDFETKIDGRYTPGQGNDLFRISFIKLLSDGSNQGLTGYQYTPYCCDNDFRPYTGSNLSAQTNTGIFNFGYPVEFDTMIDKAVSRGWPVMVHANGDHAATRTIQSFQKAGVTAQTENQYRHRMEHASLLSDQNLLDMKAIGLSPSFLIGHVGYWGWAFQQTILGPERANLLDRCRSALNVGLRISLHSDNSVTPYGPLRMMEQAISRKMEGAPNGVTANTLNEAECLTRFEALKAVTYDAAWHCHVDDIVGSLEPGKCADFVILEQSPLTYRSQPGLYSAADMRAIPVLETWKAGQCVQPLTKETGSSRKIKDRLSVSTSFIV